MLNYLYGVICESETGLDPFGNPTGKPILMESVGEQLKEHEAIDRAEKLKGCGRFGDVKVVRLVVCDYKFD